MSKLCIYNARLVDAAGERPGGILVGEDGRIEALLEGAARASAQVAVDARGRLLFPGFVDAHVHMRDPGYPHKEDFVSGTRAAACAGVTTVMCMPNTEPPVADLAGFAAAKAAGEGRAAVDFTLQAAAGRSNLDALPGLWAAGVTSFEALLSDAPEEYRLDDAGALMAALDAVARLDAVIGIYTGNESLRQHALAALKAAGRDDPMAFIEARPAAGDAMGIAVALEAARAASCRLVLRQVCTARGFALARAAKRDADAPPVAVEVTPHHLRLDDEAARRLGAFALMVPPLRTAADCAAAVAALADGTVDFVATDHAPHAPGEKAADSVWRVPGGTPGLDTGTAATLDLVARGRVPWTRVAEALAERPARLFGIGDRKGRLAAGADGDLALVDPEERRTVTPERILSKAARSPFEGVELTGWPVLTVLRGEVIAENGAFVASAPGGRFLARAGAPGAPGRERGDA